MNKPNVPMNESGSVPPASQSIQGKRSIRTSVRIAEPSLLDQRDPAELGNALLEYKRRYRCKSLSTAYEGMKRRGLI